MRKKTVRENWRNINDMTQQITSCCTLAGITSQYGYNSEMIQESGMRVGVDIGGTFTDVVRWHEGRLTLHKRLSTPDDPSRAMLAGLETIAGRLDALSHVAHGSTVATNAILERKGAKAALITTQG